MDAAKELSLYITDGGGWGNAVRLVVAEWARAGLLVDSYWSDPSLVEDDGPRAYQDCAPSLLDLTGDERNASLPLAHIVAARPYSMIRLIAVQLAPTSSGPDPAARDTAVAVHRFLKGILPTSAKVVCINLIVPASGVADLPRSTLIQGWDANVLASPEDRPSGEHANALVTDQNFAAHAALHSAVTGGLFVVQSDAPFDRTNALGNLDVSITRCFARSVAVEPFFDQLESQTFDYQGEWPTPSGGKVTASFDSFRTARTVAVAAKDLDNGALLFRPYQPKPAPRPQTIGLLAALRLFFRNIWNRIRKLPSTVAGRIQAGVETRATSLVRGVVGLGEGSALLPTVGGRDTFSNVGELNLVGRDAASVLEQLNSRQVATVTATPMIWEAIRTVSFALIDGSKIPEPFPNLMIAGTREVVVDPHAVAPDPASGPFVFGDETASRLRDLELSKVLIRPCDAAKAQLVNDLLLLQLAEATRTPETDENAEPTDDQDAQALRAAALDAALHELESWQRGRNSSFLWLLTEQVGREANKAQLAFQEAWNRLRTFLDPPTTNEAGAIKKTFRLRSAVVFFGVIVAVLVSFIAPKVFLASLLIGSAWFTVIAAAAILAMGFSYLAFCRRMFAIEYRVQSSMSHYDECVEIATKALSEIARLTAIYSTMLDWDEIIGWCVHHPWGADVVHKEDAQSYGLESLIAPHAMKLARATAEPQLLRRLANGYAKKRLYRVGWLNEVYLKRSGDARIAEASEGVIELGDLNADRDAGRDSRARDAVFRSFTNEKFSEEFRRFLTKDLASYCSESGPNNIIDHVTAGAGPLGVVPPPSTLVEFLAGAVQTDGFISKRGLFKGVETAKIDRKVCWMPVGVDIPIGGVCENRPYTIDAGDSDRYVVSIVVIETKDKVPVQQLMTFSDSVVAAPEVPSVRKTKSDIAG